MLVGLEKKIPDTPPVSPFLACLLFFCQLLVLFAQMQKASSKGDHAKTRPQKERELIIIMEEQKQRK